MGQLLRELVDLWPVFNCNALYLGSIARPTMENLSDLREAHGLLVESLKLLDKLGEHLAAADVDRARVRLAKRLPPVHGQETSAH